MNGPPLAVSGGDQQPGHRQTVIDSAITPFPGYISGAPPTHIGLALAASTLAALNSTSFVGYDAAFRRPRRLFFHLNDPDDVSSARSKSPSEIFSPPQRAYLDNHSVAGDEPLYQIPMAPNTQQTGRARRGNGPLTTDVLRNQFNLDPRRAGNTNYIRPWGSGVDYPPPSLRNFLLSDDMLFEPESENHQSTIDVDALLNDYNAINNKLEEYLEERTKVNRELQRELRGKEQAVEGCREDLKNAWRFPDAELRKEFASRRRSRISKAEGEISELKERLRQRRLESEAIIQQVLGYERDKKVEEEVPLFARLAKPVSERGTTPSLVVQKHKIRGFPDKPYEILVPDWFPVFASYHLVKLTDNQPMAERFRELLNTIHRLEDEIKIRKAKEAETGQKAFVKKWHEPAPNWEHAMHRKNGG
ncbi:hypothetical protein ACRE_013480 [Hapsidospora chrysogenum ATCC 11550]|uniref:Uncharacterized protein n=1 Tax=Hapsidospora chrysogenum (strain ATCC 11550 / CBS 779.69 / DSM 880 / IAM 14645 / JCM 23072 / IMI 49137) TaxID=857340 RepID=A0A086TED4_HAPC1|nr:hypothetical protein ACRE_013480 [Hapsidospora chrysogenum ATCC 11550]